MRLIDVDTFKREHRMAYMCGDCDRNTRECEYDSGFSLMDFCGWLDDAPTIESQQWTLCSERLPDYGVSVLTWDGSCYCVEKRIPYIRDEDGEPISSDWWVSDDYDERESDYYPNLRDGACIAWMPLPEPYTEDDDGKTNL